MERLRIAYDALNSGEIETALDSAADDLVVHTAGPDPPIRGKDAVRAFVAPDAFEEQLFEPLEFRENGDRVFVWLKVSVRGKGSGIALEQEVGHVWTFTAALATELIVTFDRKEALKAAGLSDSDS